MFNWLKRKLRSSKGTADSFVVATGGSWGEPSDAIAGDGGSQKDFVTEVLEKAALQAKKSVKVGERFTFTITDIPRGISGPHEIIFGVMMRAGEYGLFADSILNEQIHFTRTE